VPTYGRPQHLFRLLDSIVHQTYGNFQIVLVCQAYSQAELAAIKTRLRDMRVTLLAYDEGIGVTEAKNRGVEAADGEYLVFVDDDVEMGPHWLELLVAPFSDGSIGAVGGHVNNVGRWTLNRHLIYRAFFLTGSRYSISKAGFNRGVVGKPVEAHDAQWFPTCNLAVRRSVMAAAGPFDPVFLVYGDVDLTVRITRLGWRIRYVPEACVDHHEAREHSHDVNRFVEETEAMRVYFLRKHYPGDFTWLPDYFIHFCLRSLFLQTYGLHIGKLKLPYMAWKGFRRGFAIPTSGKRRTAASAISDITLNELVSIIVPTYGRPQHLFRLLDSIVHQTYGNFQIVLVCQAYSQTDLGAIKARLKDTRVTLLAYDEGIGATEAKNRGIEAAGGEYLVFVDDDVEMGPDWLELLLEPFSDRSIGAVGGHVNNTGRWTLARRLIYRAFFLTGSRYSISKAGFNRGVVGKPVEAHDAQWLPSGNLAVRRSVMAEVGTFDPVFRRVYEDVDLTVRITRLGWRIRYVPEACVDHHEARDLSLSPNRFVEETEAMRVYFLRKHYPGDLTWLPDYFIHFCLRSVFLQAYGFYTRQSKLPYAAWKGFRRGFAVPIETDFKWHRSQ
jgi:GT2 family glycosyltransferase